MSETVILSKTSSRQRPQPREPPTATAVVGDAGRLDKMSGKSKSGTALVMVKELVQRDNSRLVKDLMTLLAIREATKEGTIERHPCAAAEVDLLREETLLKNRPGSDTVTKPTMGHDGGCGVAAGTKATAAVASLLHRTATKEFSSLAGEMIAIADDSNEESPLTDTDTSVASGTGMPTVHDDDDGAMMMMMLHADAAAAAPNTSENSTDDNDGLERRAIPTTTTTTTTTATLPNGGLQTEHKTDEEATVATTAVAVESKLGRCFLSGPVPVRAVTPVPPPQPSVVVLTLEQKLDKLLDSVVKIKADMHRRIDRLGRRVEQIHLDVQLNIDSTDRALLRNDLLLIGIPCREREDLQHCFRAVCRALEYTEQDIPAVDIRRQRVSSGGAGNRRGKATTIPSRAASGGPSAEPLPPAPIVVEFMFKTLRDQFYRAYQAKRVLRLSDIGIGSDRRFFVNEVLTKYNQKLMAEAVRRKRLGLLHSVYTVDGIVYVQRAAGEKGTKVTSFSSMN
uniref:Uncharacterized protein n=1 Tax=Anopheles dirus TaxID=7168 RepID=A0A182N8C2_9DIPT